MKNSKARFAFALLVPALFALSISEAAAQKQSPSAARAECFRQANEAATPPRVRRETPGVCKPIGTAPGEWESVPDAMA
jgi:hypothetical protein